MATNEEELSVILSLKDQFSRQITNPLAKMEVLRKSFETVGRSAKLAAGIIAGSFALTARTILNSADELVKLNSITGISIEKLQKLGLAAELNGSSMGELAAGLKHLSRNASEAARGSDIAAATFKKLGINVLGANGEVKESEQLFNDVVIAISKMQNKSEQTAVAMQLLGRSGQSLLPLIKQGAEGFDKIGKIAEDMGIVIKSETVEALETFGDQLTVLKKAGQALVAEGLLVIANSLPDIIDGFFIFAETVNDVKRKFNDLISTIGVFGEASKGFVNRTVEAVGKVVTNIPELFEAVTENSEAFWKGFKEGAQEVAGFAEKAAIDAQKKINENQLQFEDEKRLLNAFRERVQGAIKAVAELGAANKDLAKTITGGPASIEGAMEKLFEAQKNSMVTYRATGDQMRHLEENIKLAKDAYEEYLKLATKDGDVAIEEANNLFTLTKTLEHATTARDNYNASLEREKAFKDKLQQSNQQYIEDQETAAELAKDFDFSMTKGQLEDMVIASYETGQNLRDMFAIMAEARDSDPLAGLVMALKDVAKQVVNMRGYFGGLFRDMEGAFSNAIESMITGGTKMKNILKNLFNDIKRSFIKMVSDMVAQQMIKQIAGLILGGVGAGGGQVGGSAGGSGSGGSNIGGMLGMGGMALSGGLTMSGLGADLGSVSGVSGSSIAMMGAVGGAAIGAEGISKGDVAVSAGGMALSGAAIGTMIMPGIGTAVGAIVGAAYGAYAGNKEKKKQEKAKEEAAAQAAAQQALLEEQRKKAAELVEKEIIGRYGGGLADPGEAAAIGQIFSGGVTPEDLDKMGINPADVLAREGQINGMTNITVGAPNINLNVSSINSAYDVRQVAQDLGYHFTQALQDAAASNP